MFSTASTLRQLRDAVDRWIDQLGPGTPVGSLIRSEADPLVYVGNKLNENLMMAWVIVDESGKIVGEEAADDELRMQPGCCNAVAVH